jgi:hypothetical protein
MMSVLNIFLLMSTEMDDEPSVFSLLVFILIIWILYKLGKALGCCSGWILLFLFILLLGVCSAF